MLDLPTIDPVLTGQNIVRLRKQAGLTVHDLQNIFGFNSPQAIYKWQSGASLPSIDNLIVLARVLHVRMDDILVTRESIR
ncbi:MAG: helix-turn-helix transcriptional regulator [Anaerotignum sp.]|nr:helix-turn-helix transcriptional regulator [Anaerotignum sp.]